ncbi:MAG: deoxyribose-phosphate aldolase [bacterium]|jgi:deoxyribose-phosphate aldolase
MPDFEWSDTSETVKNILQKEIENTDRPTLLKQILGMIDLTTLGGDDTTEKVLQLCESAKSYFNGEKGIPNVAAVCVYPVFARTVHQALKGTDIRTASVAGAFPSGQSPLTIRLEEVKYAVDHGAQEIDMVISRGRLIEGDESFVQDEIRMHKEACGDAHLKVILETGELKDPEMIYKASKLALSSGADFIKTSTGKITPAATPEVFYVMLQAIHEFYRETGKKKGVKAAGGISTSDDALKYFLLTRAVLGEAWLNPAHFRIGASRLVDNIYHEILTS